MPVNPIRGTRRLTQLREDHLTEFFAGWLDIDQAAREAYYGLVVAPHASAFGWPSSRIDDIDTQRSFVCGRPDLTLTLSDGHIIAVEHKIDAVETLSPASEEGEQVGQLKRYLDEPCIDAVAFVRSTLKPPGDDVLSSPKYIRPKDRHHFLWRDFYPLLESSSSRYAAWLREEFEVNGYRPPHPFVGELETPEARANFAKFWLPVRTLAHELGWNLGAGSVVELYLTPRDAHLSDTVWINPTESMLLVRVTPQSPSEAEAIRTLMSNVAGELGFTDVTEIRTVPRTAGRATVIDVAVPMHRVLGQSHSGPDVESHLFTFVAPLLRTLATNQQPQDLPDASEA